MSIFWDGLRAWVESMINLVRSEGAAASKRVDAVKHATFHNILAERGCRIMAYAYGADCNSAGTIAGQMVLRLRNSPAGTLGNAEGIVNAGDTVYVFDASTGYAWRCDHASAVPPVDDVITITDAEIYFPSNPGLVPIDYTTLVLANLDVIVVGRDHSLKIAEDEIAWSTEPHGNNAASIPMEDDCPVDIDWWAEEDNLEDDVLTEIVTNLNVIMDPSTDTIRDRIIDEDALTLDALMSLKGNLLPDGCMQYFTGYGGFTKAYPLGWQAGAGTPNVAAPYTTGGFGSKNELDLKLRLGESMLTRAMTGGNIAQLLNRFKGKSVRFVVVYKHNAGTDDLTMNINDGLTTTSGLIDTSTAANYTAFYVDKDMAAGTTDFYLEIINDTGGAGGARGYIAFIGLFFMSKSGNYWMPMGDEYYEIINLLYSFSALADNTFANSNKDATDGAGNDPCIEGAIVGIHTLATLKTVDAAGSTDFGIYKCDSAGAEAEDATYITRIAINTRVGRSEWTPPWGTTAAPVNAPGMIPAGDWGSFITYKVTAVGGGAPAGGRITSKIWVIKP